jgi:hypothetical protein
MYVPLTTRTLIVSLCAADVTDAKRDTSTVRVDQLENVFPNFNKL